MKVCFEVDASLPRLGQAVSLGLAVMRVAKVTRWADLRGLVPNRVHLSEPQLELLREHVAVLSYVRVAGVDGGQKVPTVTVSVCPYCSRWQLVEGAGPSKCQLTSGCGGVPVRVQAAGRVRHDR